MKQDTNSYPKTLGLVGCGHWGKNLARNFHDLGALHTICDVDASTNTRLKELYPDIHLTEDLDAMLENSEIQQVAIASPAILHYEMCEKALLAGKDVYVEKPFCLLVEHAEKIRKLALESSRIVMVGHLLQYHPAVCRLQDMVRDGIFGKLFRITSNRLNLGKIRTEENVLWSFAPHDISVVMSLAGSSRPVRVRAFHNCYIHENIADCSTVDIEFTGGINAQIHVSWLHPFKEQKLCVIGESAMAVFDDTRDWSNKLRLRRNYFSQKEFSPVSVPQKEPLLIECSHFLDCCKNRSMPKTDPLEALEVLKILEAAEQSAESNGREINLFTDNEENR